MKVLIILFCLYQLSFGQQDCIEVNNALTQLSVDSAFLRNYALTIAGETTKQQFLQIAIFQIYLNEILQMFKEIREIAPAFQIIAQWFEGYLQLAASLIIAINHSGINHGIVISNLISTMYNRALELLYAKANAAFPNCINPVTLQDPNFPSAASYPNLNKNGQLKGLRDAAAPFLNFLNLFKAATLAGLQRSNFLLYSYYSQTSHNAGKRSVETIRAYPSKLVSPGTDVKFEALYKSAIKNTQIIFNRLGKQSEAKLVIDPLIYEILLLGANTSQSVLDQFIAVFPK